MQLVLFIIYFWSWDTVRAVYDLCVTGDPMTPNDLCFSFKRNILSFTFILITLLSIKTVDYIRPSRFVVDVWIGIITALAPFDPGSFTKNRIRVRRGICAARSIENAARYFGGKSFRQVKVESPYRERSVTTKWWDLPSSRLVGPYSCHSTHVTGW